MWKDLVQTLVLGIDWKGLRKGDWPLKGLEKEPTLFLKSKAGDMREEH